MMRPFAPPAFAFDRAEFHARAVEQRLTQSGEYVRHLPADKPHQWVVMNYQFIPVAASIQGDYLINGASPRLWGYLDHFADKPELYREGDSVRPARGSQFEVRGLMFNAKRVDVNHVGYVSIELVQVDACGMVRQEFFVEQKALLCPVPECG